MNKLTKSTLIAGLVLSVGAMSTLAVSPKANAETVLESNQYKSVTLFSKAEIKTLTGLDVTVKNAPAIQKALSEVAVWEEAGYETSEATLIANRVKLNASQSLALLQKVANVANLDFKVIVIKNNFPKAELGVQSHGSAPEVEAPETEKPGDSSNAGEEESAEQTSDIRQLQIELDYKKGDIQLQYQVNSNGTIKAQYKNGLTKENFQGAKAEEKVKAVLTGIDLNSANQSDIEKHVVKKLNAGSDYKQFQLQAQFTDNTKVKIKIKK